MTMDLRQGYFVCWSDTTTHFFEYKPERETCENVTRPVVFEDLTMGIKAKLVPAQGDSSGTEESEDDDAYLKRV